MPHYPAFPGVIVVASLAFATALAIYESPQARQLAEDVRRKLAVALYKLGDEINPKPDEKQPRFNRPEDAEGFLKSEASQGMDGEADDDAKRRQREELLYWNAVKLAQEEKERAIAQLHQTYEDQNGPETYGLKQENSNTSDQETCVYTSGTNQVQKTESNLRNRGIKSSIGDTDPYNDKYHGETESDNSFIISKYASSQGVVSDIYDATEAGDLDFDEHNAEENFNSLASSNVTKAQNIHASIHAWAESAQSGSNLNMNDRSSSMSPKPTLSDQSNIDFESLSTGHDIQSHMSFDGDLTPTDTGSIVCSSEGTLWEGQSIVPSDTEIVDDMSATGESSIAGTWSEVDSVVSENDLF
ncbi:hypothetical protein OnM2_086005 [Erysiphe neolycopersici]|uniref:Uncharacterized protein n=1 Tax=Erysiphe neolycopersici TaxID=212602 RepID=A0A420HEJ5_9PEZI|nr:hypothetical protein OnM2_086005 [Erysiphe neolycopersici]